MPANVQTIDLSAGELVQALLTLSKTEQVSILDSCSVGHLGSHLLIAGIDPLSVEEHHSIDGRASLAKLRNATEGKLACIFTISYDLGRKLHRLTSELDMSREPDAFVAQYDMLVVHDYDTGATRLCGNDERFGHTEEKLRSAAAAKLDTDLPPLVTAESNLSKLDYLERIDTVQEFIRDGMTYQTNLTQQISVEVGDGTSPQTAFYRLRRDHPAPFAAYIERLDSNIASASPERFFKIDRVRDPATEGGGPTTRRGAKRRIETSPIKGTRRRGNTLEEDAMLRDDLVTGAKDRAENTMIVDLLRNDLGHVCEYGSVRVDKLCELEEHPTLFHLVSTVSGELREDANFADVIRALFPCGSITGAPKISTMRIIDELEPGLRGLPMGGIGYSIPDAFDGLDPVIDLSVAIRTMVFRDGVATFNVGGGITIDSDPEQEYEESLLKAKALLMALNARYDHHL